MMFRFCVIIFLFVSCLCGLHGCAAGSSGSNEQDTVRGFKKSILREDLSRFDETSASVPKEADVYLNFILGELAFKEERFDDALVRFEKAADGETGAAPKLRERLAELYVRSGLLPDALAQIERALEGNQDDISLLKLQAGLYSSVHEVDKAVLTYRRLIELAPEEQDFFMMLASLYMQVGDFDNAIMVLQDLLKKFPDSLFGHYYLARVLEASGDIKGAEKYYKSAIKINPSAHAIQLDYARSKALHGDKDKAIEILQNILREDPNSVKARKLLGQFLWEGKKHDEALTELEKAQALEDNPIETRLKIALIKLEKRDFEGAVSELNLILATTPDNAPARYFLASAYAAINQLNSAIAELEKIRPDQKMYMESRMLAAYIARQERLYDKAAKFIKEALREKVDDVQLLLFLVSVYREAEQLKLAIASMEKVVELEPNDDSHQFTLGVLYDEQDSWKAAEKTMRRAIELNPTNAPALNYLGYSLTIREGSYDEAETLIKKALEIEPENGYYIDSLGWLFFQTKRYDEAGDELEKAVELVPDDAVVLEHLAEVRVRQGMIEKALLTFRKALLYAPESDDKEVGSRLEKRIKELEKIMESGSSP